MLGHCTSSRLIAFCGVASCRNVELGSHVAVGISHSVEEHGVEHFREKCRLDLLDATALSVVTLL